MNETKSSQPITATSPQADPQAREDTRGIALEQVGISRVLYPITITGWENDPSRIKEVDGLFDLTVSLAAKNRGIHMSRLIESLHQWKEPLGPKSLQNFLSELRQKQGAEAASMTCNFKWFISRPAPKTGHSSWQGI